MNKSILLLVALFGLACAITPLSESDHRFLFVQFAKQHAKVYAHHEFFAKYEVFKSNLDMIRRHNAGNHSYKMAMNQFGDMTWEEFRSTMLGYKKSAGAILSERAASTARAAPFVANSNVAVPDSIDWTTKGAVTPVKNQEQCGSCWAFSTTGSVEGAWFIAKNQLVSLSEQQLVDCAGAFGNEGCNGGLMDDAFKYIIAEKGLCTEASYPYTARDGTCKKTCTRVTTISGFSDVTVNDENALKAAVAQQPVSVAIEADQQGFQFYSSGVFDGECGTNLDHGVLAVGYGNESGKDFWKVKNSWGSSWGDEGYIKLVRGTKGPAGQCGIAMAASFPKV